MIIVRVVINLSKQLGLIHTGVIVCFILFLFQISVYILNIANGNCNL